jgi:DNA-binding MarR family transcriptional regulator
LTLARRHRFIANEMKSTQPSLAETVPDDAPAPGFDLDAFVPYQLVRLASILSRDLAALYGARHGLTIPEWRVLAHLSQADAVSVRDIHARVDLDKPAVSRAARRLADAGLVSRSETKDRRLVALSLTAEGRALMAELAPLALSREGAALAPLSPEERAAFRHLLARLLAAHAPPEAPPPA